MKSHRTCCVKGRLIRRWHQLIRTKGTSDSLKNKPESSRGPHCPWGAVGIQHVGPDC